MYRLFCLNGCNFRIYFHISKNITLYTFLFVFKTEILYFFSLMTSYTPNFARVSEFFLKADAGTSLKLLT